MNALIQMRPAPPAQYAVNLRLPNPKALCDLVLRKCATEGFDLRNLLFGQLGPSVTGAFNRHLEAIGISVVHILRARDPFKVISAVIRLVPIPVVDLVFFGRRWIKERVRHQAVHHTLLLATIKADGGAQVSAALGPKAENPLGVNMGNQPAPSICPSRDGSRNGSDAPQVGDFMTFLEADNGTPNFVHSKLHAGYALECNTSNHITQGDFL